MTPFAPPREPFSLLRALSRIRTKLLLANLLLVIVPVAGLSFARTFERELLRSEEEGLVAVATTLAASGGEGAARERAAKESASLLGAQVRVLDRQGDPLVDTGAPEVEKLTRGRVLLSREETSSWPSRKSVRVAEAAPEPPLATRPEVARALAGQHGRATRIAGTLRSVLLYVAEPIRSPAGDVTGVVYVTRSTYPVLVSLYRVRNFLYRMAIVSGAFALVLAIFLALTISRPLRRLTTAAGQIAAGERGVSLKLSGRDEVGDLARAFDRMARELDARLDHAAGLAANVSHEFKTPLASLRGAAELLLDGAGDDPVARKRFLANIADDADRLTRLVSRLLELSRVEARHAPGVPLDYRARVESAATRARGAGADVRLVYEADHVDLVGHAEHLDTVLDNLLDNAARFAPAGRPIEVRVRDEGGGISTTVRDEGPGISEANLPRIWDRFFTTARAEGGTGLGLSIVRAIVEAHGGRVDAWSEPGRGATFSIWLPRRR